MISRVWRGYTSPTNADAYEHLLETDVLPGIAAKGIPGYRGTHVFRRPLNGEVEFVTIMWFDSLESVKTFLGESYETAYVPPQAQALLDRFDATSAHYDVPATPAETLPETG